MEWNERYIILLLRIS